MMKKKNMQKKYIRTAFFDLDGTLIDSRKDIIDTMNWTLTQLGFGKKPSEDIRRHIGYGREVLIAGALGPHATPELIDKATQVFAKRYNDHMFDTTHIFPGVLDVLEYLKEKTLMIVTNKNRDLTLRTLTRFNIEKYFQKVVGGDDRNCRKPDACPISSLLAEVKTLRQEAIMVGDSDIDVKSGKMAGIMTCGLTYGIGKKEDLEKANPDYLLDDIRKLKDIIR